MPGGKSSGKHPHNLLFSEALVQPKVTATQGTSSGSASSPATSSPLEVTGRILQKIAAVGDRLETMDARISDLTIASSSIRADIAGFRETVHNLDQHLTSNEEHVTALPGQEAELRSLQTKITDLEDRSRRDNIRLFGFPEHKWGALILNPPSKLYYPNSQTAKNEEINRNIEYLIDEKQASIVTGKLLYQRVAV
ncbi:hypothetical protein NDU88_001586 [Pleurodeles waltl]|uniref:Uncharacterized protein n=1 Tax=Pleurodeles waltl TaxID=8319 RepID=A0AAV7W0X4_PLEWA|nr:hypothetical protein NDU88_001586 [Pleurodeles waltl]